MSLTKQTTTATRKWSNGKWNPASPVSGPIPKFGDEFGADMVEIQINPNSFIAIPVDVKPGQALSWFLLSELGKLDGVGCCLSHSDASNAGGIVYGALTGVTAPTLRFKDAKAGNDDASNPRVPTDIDTSRPLFLIVWGLDPAKTLHPCIVYQNGNSPAHGGTPG